MARDYKKKSIVEGSGMIQQHEDFMDQILNKDLDINENNNKNQSNKQSVSNSIMLKPTDMLKNVQAKIPMSHYEVLNSMKYFNGNRTSIRELVAQAIKEFVEKNKMQ